MLGRASATAAGVARRSRIVALLTAIAALLALGGAGWGATQQEPADGELMVLMGAFGGKVTITPTPEGDAHPCEVSMCEYVLPQGPLTLTAEPNTSSVPPCTEPCFVHWSEAECGTNPVCETTLDAMGTIAAFFRPVKLDLQLARTDSSVTPSVMVIPAPNGGPAFCPEDGWTELEVERRCEYPYPEPTTVQLHAFTEPPGAKIQWGDDASFCDPDTFNATSCSAVVNFNPFWVTLGFGGADPPIPFIVLVHVRVIPGGSGSGTVTGRTIGAEREQIIDCGTDCSGTVDYGRRVVLNATAAAGSEFDRWVGVCSTSEHCEFSAGAVTTVRANFRRKADPPPPPPPAGPPPPPPGRGVAAVSARVLGISVTRTRRGRLVVARITVNQPTLARAQVERRRRVLARSQTRLGAGVRVLRVPLRRTVAAGRARFTVLLIGREGQRKTLQRPFVVPPRRR